MVRENKNKFVELELAVAARRGDDCAEHESVVVEVCNGTHRAALRTR